MLHIDFLVIAFWRKINWKIYCIKFFVDLREALRESSCKNPYAKRRFLSLHLFILYS